MAGPNGVLFQDPRVKPLSATGQFMAGCQYSFWLTQTLVQTQVYADGALTTPLSQPVIAASDGRFPPIYMDPAVTYRVQLFNNGVMLEDTDPYVPLATVPQSAPLTLSFITNGIVRGTIDQDGRWVINAPDITGQTGVTINGISGNDTLLLQAGSGSGQSLGLEVRAGTTSSDYAAVFRNAAGTTDLLRITGEGETFIQMPPQAAVAPAGAFQVGYLDAPPNVQNANYTVLVTDRGKTIIRSAGTGPFTWTLPNTATFPLGMMIMLVGLPGVSGNTVIAGAGGVTINWPQGNATGNRTLSTTGFMATLHLTTNNTWTISGAGIS